MITRSGQPLWAKHCLSDERGWSWCRIKSCYPCGCLLFCGSGYRRFCNRRCQQWGLRLRLGTTIECRGCCSQKRRLNFARKRAASISKPLRPQLMVQWSVCLEGLVLSPHQDMDRAQLLDLAFDALPVPKQTLQLLRCAERKARQTRASWSPGLNGEMDGETRRRALGSASCKSTISHRVLPGAPRWFTGRRTWTS